MINYFVVAGSKDTTLINVIQIKSKVFLKIIKIFFNSNKKAQKKTVFSRLFVFYNKILLINVTS